MLQDQINVESMFCALSDLALDQSRAIHQLESRYLF